MWSQTPSSAELYSFYWVVSLGSISPKWIIGLKSNFIFMTIKISFQMAFKKIVKIYTTQPSIWPFLEGTARTCRERYRNSEHSIQQAVPLHKRTPVLNTFTSPAMSPTWFQVSSLQKTLAPSGSVESGYDTHSASYRPGLQPLPLSGIHTILTLLPCSKLTLILPLLASPCPHYCLFSYDSGPACPHPHYKLSASKCVSRHISSPAL